MASLRRVTAHGWGAMRGDMERHGHLAKPAEQVSERRAVIQLSSVSSPKLLIMFAPDRASVEVGRRASERVACSNRAPPRSSAWNRSPGRRTVRACARSVLSESVVALRGCLARHHNLAGE
ncbi:hypothetical protein BC628DRAFT_115654 [Trametes gibbosa]|nr:hypothetical protein BC628DRAFT_609387 [Trametes gibbosa]KAI0828357.1 hypothetical protein BC628DRAFT_115654 [Trametes gibbosa]